MSEKELKPGELEMLYGLDEEPPAGKFVLYAIQHLIYFIAGAAIMPVIVGAYLGLDSAAIASMLQRTFLLCGAVSILQAVFGHRFPIVDGPAGLWMGMFILLTSSAGAFGKPLELLRTDLQTGMIIAGIVCALLGISGLMPKVAKLFNGTVNGVFLVLMVLQISATIVKGMTGVTDETSTISGKSVFCFLLTAAVIVFFNIKAKGFIRSIATLLGVVAGWIVAAAIGISPEIQQAAKGLFTQPQVFAWGAPTVDTGVILTCVLGSLLLFSNLIASITGMCTITGTEVTPRILNRGTFFYGITTVLTGAGSSVGFVPFASSIGTTAMTRVASRKPFILGSAFMIVLGVIGPVGAFFAAIPPSVGYSAMMIVFCMILAQGLQKFAETQLGPRESMTIGISLILGMGIMFLPAGVFASIPQGLRYIVSNGLVDGIIIAILLEHVLLKEKKGSCQSLSKVQA